MKLTTIVFSSVLTLGSTLTLDSTLALAQVSSGSVAAAHAATGGPPVAGAIKSDNMDPSGTRDSAHGSGSGNASATTAGGATGGPAGAGSSNAIKNDIVGSSKEPARR